MKIEIKFTDTEARDLEWLLRTKYNSKANLRTLSKMAIREIAAEAATLQQPNNTVAADGADATNLSE